MPELDHHPEHESHYDCEFCRDTGKLDGSDYYDCAHCSVAQERVKLEERMGNMKRSMPTNDAMWSLVKSERKRVLAVQAAELALLKSKLLQAERELAEVRKDAQRYRWLRDKTIVVSWSYKDESGNIIRCVSSEVRMDERIDFVAASVAQANKEPKE
jgi:hypothetical protein